MKNYVMLFTFTAAVIAWIAVSPGLAVNSLTGVEVIKVSNENISHVISCSGRIQAASESAVSYGYPLKVSKIHVRAGDTVKQGQKLLDVDRVGTFYALEYLNFAAADAGEASSVTIPDELQKLIDQYKNLLPSNFSSYFTSSSSSAPGGEDGAGISYDDIPGFIFSPEDGVVTALAATEGGFTVPAASIAVVRDSKNVQVVAVTGEGNLPQLASGQHAVISGSGFDGTYAGTVRDIYTDAADSGLSSSGGADINVIIDVDDPDGSLKPGLTANVSIITKVDPKALVLPYEAIEEDNLNVQYVYLYQSGKVHRRDIRTGKEFPEFVEVESGVNDGDCIVLDPPDGLMDGQAVRLLPAGAEAAAK
jgi:multidrug efflux pump subunit AcrA (membrane-fusion protein)